MGSEIGRYRGNVDTGRERQNGLSPETCFFQGYALHLPKTMEFSNPLTKNPPNFQPTSVICFVTSCMREGCGHGRNKVKLHVVDGKKDIRTIRNS